MRKLSSREKFSRNFADLILWINWIWEYPVTLGEVYRTKEQQEIHRKAGRSKVKVSQHQKRLAADIYIWDKNNPSKPAPDRIWIKAGEEWCNMDDKHRWGGNFGVKEDDRFKVIGWDRWHFEMRD